MSKLKTNKASKRKDIVYAWVMRTNKNFAMKEARRLGHNSFSEYIDSLIQRQRSSTR